MSVCFLHILQSSDKKKCRVNILNKLQLNRNMINHDIVITQAVIMLCK